MFQLNIKSENGSALLEFITFILLGQLLVFGGSILISLELGKKVELQVLAGQTARNLALNRDFVLPTDVLLVRDPCTPRVVCITLKQGSQTVSAVSYQ